MLIEMKEWIKFFQNECDAVFKLFNIKSFKIKYNHVAFVEYWGWRAGGVEVFDQIKIIFYEGTEMKRVLFSFLPAYFTESYYVKWDSFNVAEVCDTRETPVFRRHYFSRNILLYIWTKTISTQFY